MTGEQEVKMAWTAEDLFQHHDALCAKAKALMERKNHDYRGGSGDRFANFRGSAFLGVHPVVGIMLRMQDKMMRVKTFCERGELVVQGEGIEDSIVDLINYAVLISGIISEMKQSEEL